MLSATCKYALRSIIFIAIKTADGGTVNVKRISSELKIPMQFLSKILQVFVKKGLLVSQRGPNGGFAFKKSPFEISIMEVIEIIDGHELFNNCVIGTKTCYCIDKNFNKCSMHDKYNYLREEILRFFENETIVDIAENYNKQETLFLSF